MFDVIYYNNDTIIKVVGVRNSFNSDYINNATAQILGIKSYGVTPDSFVSEESFPINLAYEEGSNGNYSGILPFNIELEPGKKYICQIEVLTAEEAKGYWEFSFTCRMRQD